MACVAARPILIVGVALQFARNHSQEIIDEKRLLQQLTFRAPGDVFGFCTTGHQDYVAVRSSLADFGGCFQPGVWTDEQVHQCEIWPEVATQLPCFSFTVNGERIVSPLRENVRKCFGQIKVVVNH